MATRKSRLPKPAKRAARTRPIARSGFQPSSSVLAHVLVPWMVVGLLEIGLAALISGTSLTNAQELSLPERIALRAHELVLLAIAVSAIALLCVCGEWMTRSVKAARLDRTFSAARTVIVWSAVFLYAISWAAYWNTGVFVDRDALSFWWSDPVQILLWIYPPLAIGVVIATIAVSLVLTVVTPSWVRGWKPWIQRRVVMVAGSSVIASSVLALTGSWLATRGGADAAPSYVANRDNRTGPLLHIVADVLRRIQPPPSRPVIDAATDVRITRPRVVSMEDYMAGVTRRRLRPWNVLTIQIESLRSDQLRAYGGSRDVMPTIDTLARASRVFTNAYVQASHSNYADLVPLSSQYPLRSTEIYRYPPNPTYPRVLIYDILKAMGYKTAVFSSQNEQWGGMINYHRLESLDRFFDGETFEGPHIASWEDLGFANWIGQTRHAGSVDDRYTVSAAIDWLTSVTGTPFFLHMNLQSSHVPYVVPATFQRPFGPRTLDFAIQFGNFPRDKTQTVKDRYADSLNYADAQIAQLFGALMRLGVWDRTLIIVGGDNGEAFYEHGFSAHASSLFNEVVKVPMIVHGPGIPAVLDDRPAMFLDVPPTVLDLLGLPPHPGFQGISLFGEQADPDRSIYMVAQTPLANQVAIVRAGRKLLFSAAERRYLLFDLRNDPSEQHDIMAANPNLVRELGIRLQRWRFEQLQYYEDVPRHAREYPPVLD